LQCCESSSEERSAGNPHATICGNRRWATASGDPVAGAKFPRATHLFIKVCGETHYLWRAVDQDGNVLDILVQSQRNAKAATRFFKKLLKGLRYAPRVMITDKLASYGAARKQMRLSIEHRQHKGLNNRAENSHQPTRQKERQMKKFKSPGKAQRFLSAHGPINNLFRPRRHLLKATAYRAARKQAFSTWLEAIDHAVAA
jgi:putative transposase